MIIVRNIDGFSSALEKFFVHPEERGTGIGIALAEKGVRHALNSFKTKYVYADVLLPEKRLYNSLSDLGFKQIGREKDRIKMALDVIGTRRQKKRQP